MMWGWNGWSWWAWVLMTMTMLGGMFTKKMVCQP